MYKKIKNPGNSQDFFGFIFLEGDYYED